MHLVPDISFLNIASYADALPVGTFYVRALVDTLAYYPCGYLWAVNILQWARQWSLAAGPI